MLAPLPRPTRFEVPTCVGCGAMSRFGSCATGCAEQRLDLVRAAAYDALAAHGAAMRERDEGLTAAAEQIASSTPTTVDWEESYRKAQALARSAIREHAADEQRDRSWDQPSEPAITWWCMECGGIDAPQPCLGICVWRTVEWVDAAHYQREHERFLVDRDRERRLRALMLRIAHVTPRAGQWERSLKALQRDLRRTLEASPAAPAPEVTLEKYVVSGDARGPFSGCCARTGGWTLAN